MLLIALIALLWQVIAEDLRCDDTSMLQSVRTKTKVSGDQQSDAPTTRQCSKLGIMNLDGYYWPTQPGDVGDKRTWCTVDAKDVDKPDYACKYPPFMKKLYGEFEVTFAVVEGFTFEVAATFEDIGLAPWKNALKNLMKPEAGVCAITCNVGFCSGYQPQVEQAMNELIAENPGWERRPVLLGSPSLMAAFDSWGLIKDPDKEVVIVLTSFYPGLSKVLVDLINRTRIRLPPGPVDPFSNTWQSRLGQELEKTLGMELVDAESVDDVIDQGSEGIKILERLVSSWAGALGEKPDDVVALAESRARNFVPVGWNNNPGYSPVVVGGAFHNAHVAIKEYPAQLRCILKALERRGKKAVAIIAESTEMPMHSNHQRMNFNFPVWDISTVGMCLMKASATFNSKSPKVYATLFNNSAFKGCMMYWYAPTSLEKKFGTQKNGRLKFYEDYPPRRIPDMTCTGGRTTQHGRTSVVGRLMQNYDPGVPLKVGDVKDVCFLTGLCRCGLAEGANGVGCPEACPGSGNCGGGNFNRGFKLGGNPGYPCGTRGEGCINSFAIPRVILNPSRRIDNNPNKCLAGVNTTSFKACELF